jgi:hypothetical protein
MWYLRAASTNFVTYETRVPWKKCISLKAGRTLCYNFIRKYDSTNRRSDQRNPVAYPYEIWNGTYHPNTSQACYYWAVPQRCHCLKTIWRLLVDGKLIHNVGVIKGIERRVMAHFKVRARYLLGEAEKKHEILRIVEFWRNNCTSNLHFINCIKFNIHNLWIVIKFYFVIDITFANEVSAGNDLPGPSWNVTGLRRGACRFLCERKYLLCYLTAHPFTA